MNIAMLLEMIAEAAPDRVGFGRKSGGLTYAELLASARSAATLFAERDIENVGLVDLNSEAVPITIFGAAMAGKPYSPINYRLADEPLRAIVARIAPALVVVDEPVVARIAGIDGIEVMTRAELLSAVKAPSEMSGWSGDPDDVAVLLFTSGTTGEPKAAVMRHRHLTSYVIGTVEFLGSGEEEAALVSVPPYHIAGLSAVLTGVYSGRRVVQLQAFDPADWVGTAKDEGITQAMVVPTMLGRILDHLNESGERLPVLGSLSYGGGKMPMPVIESAMTLLPHVDFVNAYGLTETSSTIAVLNPDDHRRAFSSTEPLVRARLGSVGRPLPTVELEIRDENGEVLGPHIGGEIFVRGDQVSGEYKGIGSLTDADGWFRTKDGGYLDDEGYLFIEGRLDDVIVRGGENMSPGEIEEVLLLHEGVADVAVVGVPDTEWGEKIIASVVPRPGAQPSEEELQAWVRERLRSSKMPAHVDFVEELPYNETGKLLRRILRLELAEKYPA